jgi:pimeloyl-ACP methyl ester carboxylesterase
MYVTGSRWMCRPDAGHNLPQEAPQAFATAVLQLARPGQAR